MTTPKAAHFNNLVFENDPRPPLPDQHSYDFGLFIAYAKSRCR